MSWELAAQVLKFLGQAVAGHRAGRTEWIKLGNKIFDTDELIDVEVTATFGPGNKPVRISIHREGPADAGD